MATAINGFEAAVDTLDTKRAETATARGARDNNRDALITLAREQLKTMRLAAGNDPEQLAKVNLDAYDETASAASVGESTPFALIDFGILRHTINFRDSATPDKGGKPKGMLGAEIWAKIGGPAPASDADYSMLGLDTSSPYVVNFQMEDAGKTVWYRLRWVTKTGEKGGWGETVSATVNG